MLFNIKNWWMRLKCMSNRRNGVKQKLVWWTRMNKCVQLCAPSPTGGWRKGFSICSIESFGHTSVTAGPRQTTSPSVLRKKLKKGDKALRLKSCRFSDLVLIKQRSFRKMNNKVLKMISINESIDFLLLQLIKLIIEILFINLLFSKLKHGCMFKKKQVNIYFIC